MSELKPSDFDWVTARNACSADGMFEALLARSRQNVSVFNELRKRDGKAEDCHVQATVPGIFSVSRGRVGAGPAHAVRFMVNHGAAIDVEGSGVTVKFRATLTLNDNGDCRFKVGEELLDEWQLLRRALEPLLFDVKDWDVF